MPDAIGASTVGVKIHTLNLGFSSNYEIQFESIEDLDSIDAPCNTYLGYSYPKVGKNHETPKLKH